MKRWKDHRNYPELCNKARKLSARFDVISKAEDPAFIVKELTDIIDFELHHFMDRILIYARAEEFDPAQKDEMISVLSKERDELAFGFDVSTRDHEPNTAASLKRQLDAVEERIQFLKG